MSVGSEPWIGINNNLRDLGLGVASVWFPQVPGVYSGLFEWYEDLHCLTEEELTILLTNAGIFLLHNDTHLLQLFGV